MKRKWYLFVTLLLLMLATSCGKEEKSFTLTKDYTCAFPMWDTECEFTIQADGEAALIKKEDVAQLQLYPDGPSYSMYSADGKSVLWKMAYRYRNNCEIDSQGNFTCTFETEELAMEYDASLKNTAQEMIEEYRKQLDRGFTQERIDSLAACLNGEFVGLDDIGDEHGYGFRVSGTIQNDEMRVTSIVMLTEETKGKFSEKIETTYSYGEKEIVASAVYLQEQGSATIYYYDKDWELLRFKYVYWKDLPDTYAVGTFETEADGTVYTNCKTYLKGKLKSEQRMEGQVVAVYEYIDRQEAGGGPSKPVATKYHMLEPLGGSFNFDHGLYIYTLSVGGKECILEKKHYLPYNKMLVNSFVYCATGDFDEQGNFTCTFYTNPEKDNGVYISGKLQGETVLMTRFQEFNYDSGYDCSHMPITFTYADDRITVCQEPEAESGDKTEEVYNQNWELLQRKYTYWKDFPDTYSLDTIEEQEDGNVRVIRELYVRGELKVKSETVELYYSQSEYLYVTRWLADGTNDLIVHEDGSIEIIQNQQ